MKKSTEATPALKMSDAELAAAFMGKGTIASSLASQAENPSLPKAIASKATWKGTLTFGLITFAVKTYTATSLGDHKIAFKQIGKSSAPLKQAMTDATTGAIVEKSAIQRGYEHTPGQFVTISDEELQACEISSDKMMEVSEFVPASQIDPIYFEKTEYLAPDKGAESPFGLLRAGLVATGRVAVVEFSSKGRLNTAVVRPVTLPGGLKGLALHHMFYENEVRDFNGWNNVPDAPQQLVDVAVQLIEQKRSDFDSSKYFDKYSANVRRMVNAKVAGQPVPSVAHKVEPITSTDDLMSQLLASLEAMKSDPKLAKVAKDTVTR